MKDAPDRAKRLKSYLGLLARIDSVTARIRGDEGGLILRADMDEEGFLESLPAYPTGRQFLRYSERSRTMMKDGYVEPMLDVARTVGYRGAFLLLPGDAYSAPTVPMFTKAWPLGCPGLGVMEKLNVPRHFGAFNIVRRNDVPYAEKEPKLVWRGSVTGNFKAAPGRRDYSSRFYVHALNTRITDDRIDLGYTQIPGPERFPAQLLRRLRANLKPAMSVPEQLRYKYLLSLEGNDVASGLKWQLSSNSAVIMPAPTRVSWAMEQDLVPFVHYVPVLPDLRDLEKVFQWCLENDDKCAEIARNGQAFVQQFLDPKAERELMLQVADAAFGKVRLVQDADVRLETALL